MNPLHWGLIGLVLALGIQTVRLANEEAATAGITAQLERERRQAAEAQKTASEEYRKKEAQFQNDKEQIQNDAKKQLARAESGRRAAVDAGDSLRDKLTGYQCPASAPAEGPTPGPGSPATGSTADLRALVLGRLDRAAEEIAGFADQSRTAGQACERSYDSVTR